MTFGIVNAAYSCCDQPLFCFMINVDHSVVFRRAGGERGSGTVVQLTSNYLVFETYDLQQDIRLNEVFANVRISTAKVLRYDGKGVVCQLEESSSIQLVTVFLRDNPVAVWDSFQPNELKLVFEKFLQDCESRYQLPYDVERPLFEFTHFLHQLLMGLKVSMSKGRTPIIASGDSGDEIQMKTEWMEIGVEKLLAQYGKIERILNDCDESQRVGVGEFFKRYVFPLSVSSRVFRYFHSSKRSPYVDQNAIGQMCTSSCCSSLTLRGLILDEFFRRSAMFSRSQNRMDFWVKDIRECLESNDRTWNVLFLGSDLTSFKLLQEFPNQLLKRLRVDVMCTLREPTKDYRRMLETTGNEAGWTRNIRYLRSSNYGFLQKYFSHNQGDFLNYDRVYSTSFLESLSNKSAAYTIAFCLELLRDQGNVQFFTGNGNYSPVREHWLMWFEHGLIPQDWKPYLSANTSWTYSSFPYGDFTKLAPIP